MKTLVFLLEGQSEKIFLEKFLPRAFPCLNNEEKSYHPVFITFSGKSDLINRVARKIRGWLTPNSFFIVICDQDHGDCCKTKQQLLEKCKQANKHKNSTVRIACRELENWYLGDLAAVESAYALAGLAKKCRNKASFRNIDNLSGKAELQKITKNEYGEIEGSRLIAAKINPDYNKNKSHSFRVFCQKIEGIIRTACQ